MLGIAVQVSGREDRKFGNNGGQLLGRGDRHFQVAARDGFELGSLLEQGGAPMGFKCCEILDCGRKNLGQCDCTLIGGRGR